MLARVPGHPRRFCGALLFVFGVASGTVLPLSSAVPAAAALVPPLWRSASVTATSTGWLVAVRGGGKPTFTLELVDHLTGRAADVYAASHHVPNGAPDDHVDVDLKSRRTFPVSPDAHVVLVTAQQVPSAPTTEPPNVAAFVLWAERHLARSEHGRFVGPLLRLSTDSGVVTLAAQIFEP